MSVSAGASWTPWGDGGSYCASCGNYVPSGVTHQCNGASAWLTVNTPDWTTLYLAQIVGLLSKLVDQTAPIFLVEEVQCEPDAKIAEVISAAADREFGNGCGINDPEPLAEGVKLSLLSARRKLSAELTSRSAQIEERRRYLEQDETWVNHQTTALAEIEAELATRGVALTEDPAADEETAWEEVYSGEQ